MNKNKLRKIGYVLRRMPLGMAAHPFLTFLAGLVVAMAVAVGFLAIFSNSIGPDQAAVLDNAVNHRQFNAKNCLNVFAIWDKRTAAAQDFLKSDFNDPFSMSATSTIDQITE